MNITQVQTSPLISQPHIVRFDSIVPGTTTDVLRAAAYAAVNETPESCYGSQVSFASCNTVATVTIYKD